MTQTADVRDFPSLFSHKKRTDWGVGVLSAERDGKRAYLFEDGEERVMGVGGIELMRKVEQPNRDQQATCARLLALLAKREGRGAAAEAPGSAAVVKQLDRLHKKYSGGFFGKDWRTDDKAMFARQTRIDLVPKAQEQLSRKSLEKLVKDAKFEQLWGLAVAVLDESGLAGAPLRSTSAKDQQELIGNATFELLHGPDSYERRFDRFVAAYATVFGETPTWQTVTALPALMSPVSQVYVEPTSFRKQLKALSRYSAFVARPNSAAYLRCLSMAHALANMLAARGEVPRDLLDVHDFVRATI